MTEIWPITGVCTRSWTRSPGLRGGREQQRGPVVPESEAPLESPIFISPPSPDGPSRAPEIARAKA